MERLKKLPIPGQRILRTMIAVWLCLLVYVLRGRQGEPLYAAMAVLQCIQPSSKSTHAVGRKRIVGTFIGAFWGLALLLLEQWLDSRGYEAPWLHFALIGTFTGIVLYCTVLLKIRETAYFSAVVFLVITIKHADDVSPFLYAFNRTLDTVIGVVVAELVNRVHLPRLRQTDTLFVSAIGDTLLGADRQLQPYSKVELQRLLDDGALFTVATSETQATVRELLPGVELRLPVITMNGAALYDMKTMEYLETVPMSDEKGRRLKDWAHAEGLPFFSNSVDKDLLVIRYEDLPNPAMQQLFEQKRRSPYRNYIHSSLDLDRGVLYLLILEKTEVLEEKLRRFREQPWAGDYRTVLKPFPLEGYSSLRIYDCAVSRRAMLKKLEARLQPARTVTFGSVPGRYDVVIESTDHDRMVRELKRRFEPVDIRGWRNIFHS
ncbi:MAG: HAD hydrolase family protein [Oscillospiraceae bacterium]|nr:HAD hydrolase family protein [Oscillospiraceae bacterium]